MAFLLFVRKHLQELFEIFGETFRRLAEFANKPIEIGHCDTVTE